MSKNYDIRNDFKVSMVAKEITAKRGNGSASRNKIETVLREFKEVTGINNLHKLSSESVNNFYSYIQESGQANSTVANKISYFNEVLEYAGANEFKQTAKELGESRENDIRTYKGNSVKDMQTVQDYFKGVDKIEFQGLYHAQRLQELAGLRMSESGGVKLLDKDINELKQGILRIDGKADLSKNDRDRVIYLDKAGIQAVLDARAWLQENNLRDIAESRPGTMKEWTAYSWRQVDILKKAGIIDANYHNHGNRHVWANQKYETIWENRTGVKIEATAKAGLFDKDWIHYVETKTGLTRDEIRKIDGEVRHEVSQQLGHERISITSTYLGKKAI